MARRFSSAFAEATGINIVVGTNPFSLCAWAMIESTASGVADAVWLTSNGFNQEWGWIGADGANWQFQTDNGPIISSAATINTWTHLALVLDGTTQVSYVNGTQIDSRAKTLAGRHQQDYHDCGYFGQIINLQDTMIFTSALTAFDVNYIRRQRVPTRSRASLYAWWPMHADSSTRDLSGNAHTLNSAGDSASTTVPPASWGAAQRPIAIRR